MPKPAAQLSADLIRRGVTMRTMRIIGPDGEFIRVQTPVEADCRVEYDLCQLCGHSKAVDKF
jgi:hypothetical protein